MTKYAAPIAVIAALLLSLAAACMSSEDTTAKPTRVAKAGDASPSADMSKALEDAGIPPKPTGAERKQLLAALKAINPDVVRYEDKAIDAARNQCASINGGGQNLDRSASIRFTYKDVTTTEAQAKAINAALKAGGFCKV